MSKNHIQRFPPSRMVLAMSDIAALSHERREGAMSCTPGRVPFQPSARLASP